MKRRIFILLLAVVSMGFYSCEKVEPTVDKIEYSADRTKAPVIKTEQDLTTAAAFVGGTYNLKLNLEAPNGIDSVFLNGEMKYAFGNGQLTFGVTIPIDMPDTDSYAVSLMVKDEIGLKTTKRFTIAKQEIKSPYLICDFTSDEFEFLPANSDRRVVFPKYAGMPDYSTKNFAWADATVESDLASKKVRFGSPGFNGGGDIDNGIPNIAIKDWEKLVNFGVTIPAETEATSLRMNLHPRKGNMRAMIALEEPVYKYIINDVVNTGTRVFKIDVYVDTQNGASHPYANDPNFRKNLIPYDGTKNVSGQRHANVGLGLANTQTFNDAASGRAGQDYGMATKLTKTDEWETLTFTYDGATPVNPMQYYVHTTNDVDIDEVNMLILVISPAGTPLAITPDVGRISNATYYIRNLRIELK